MIMDHDNEHIFGKTYEEKLPIKISKTSPVFPHALAKSKIIKQTVHWIKCSCVKQAFLRKTKCQHLSRQTCPAKSNLLLSQIRESKQCWYEPCRTKGGFLNKVYFHNLTRESCFSVASYACTGVLSAKFWITE